MPSELTPIKVRGKVGQKKKTWQPPSLHRAPKHPLDEAAGDSASHDKPRRKRFKPSEQQAAFIEKLPTEILERVIFMSGNLNLLRSSLRIGHRLSSPLFFTELLCAAFAPTWDMWFGYSTNIITRHTRRFLRAEQVPGDPTLQTAVLACKWVNSTLILQAQQKWYGRNGGPGNLSELFRSLKASSSAQASASICDAQPEPVADVESRFRMTWDVFKGRHALLLSSKDADSHDDISVLHRDVPDYLEVHPATEIPEHLLVGPFDEESAKTLFWLVCSGARLPFPYECSWELTRRGYHHMMTLDDKALALCLFTLFRKLRAFEYWSEFLLIQEAERIAVQVERHSETSAGQTLWRLVGGIIKGHAQRTI